MTKVILTFASMSLLSMLLMAAHSCEKGGGNAAVQAKESNTNSSCKSDDDCTLIKADCCGCSQGGKQIAIPRAEISARQAKLMAECKGIFCAQVMSPDPSCKLKAQCVDGRCQLR